MSQKKTEIYSPVTSPIFNPSLKRPSTSHANQRLKKKQCLQQAPLMNREDQVTSQSINTFFRAHKAITLLERISPWFDKLPTFKKLLDHVAQPDKQNLRTTNPKIFFNNADITAIKEEILATKLNILDSGDQVLARHFVFSCMKLIKNHLCSNRIYPGLFSFLVTKINTHTTSKYKSLDKDYILEVFPGPEEVIALLDDIPESPTLLRRTQALNLLEPHLPEIIAKVNLWYTPDNLEDISCLNDPSTVPVKTVESIIAHDKTITENNFVHPVIELPTPKIKPNFTFFPAASNLAPRIHHTSPNLETDSTLTDSEKEWLALLNI